jgi:hypothetical protein
LSAKRVGKCDNFGDGDDDVTDEPKRVFLGTFSDGLPVNLIIPRDGLKPATDILDAERQKRETAAAKAKLATLQAARGRARLKKALKLCFGRGRRGR